MIYTFPNHVPHAMAGLSVEAETTSCKHFVITPGKMLYKFKWTLTHTKTGCAAARSNSKRRLRLVAGAYSGLPIRWGSIKTPQHGKLAKLPKWVADYLSRTFRM